MTAQQQMLDVLRKRCGQTRYIQESAVRVLQLRARAGVGKRSDLLSALLQRKDAAQQQRLRFVQFLEGAVPWVRTHDSIQTIYF